MKRSILLLLVIAAAAAAVVYFALVSRRREIILTGVVTTDEVIVGSEIQGRMQQLLVQQGETVTNGELLALIQPQEWRASLGFYTNNARQSAAQVAQAEADLVFQQAQSSNLIWQSVASLAAAKDQLAEAKADLENAELNFKRQQELHTEGVNSSSEFDQARTAYDAAKARLESLRHQAAAAEAAVGLAKATAGQVAARRAALAASKDQRAAASAQAERAAVQLNYTRICAPTNGIVNVRAALEGDVVSPGQAILTLINPDQLWVRADVEESYIDTIRLGDQLPVRLAGGAQRTGTVFFRGIDADYATQRDVSRTKRDIKTFEIRLRCHNEDRALAVGMTAYVALTPPAR